jgi:hypothetical protein
MSMITSYRIRISYKSKTSSMVSPHQRSSFITKRNKKVSFKKLLKPLTMKMKLFLIWEKKINYVKKLAFSTELYLTVKLVTSKSLMIMRFYSVKSHLKWSTNLIHLWIMSTPEWLPHQKNGENVLTIKLKSFNSKLRNLKWI